MKTPQFFLIVSLCVTVPACGPADTMLPVAVSKAESTPNFPKTWDGVLTADTTPTQGTKPVPTELVPKRGKAERPNAIALIIGIEKYRGELPAATGAEADAQLFPSSPKRRLACDGETFISSWVRQRRSRPSTPK